MAKQPNRKELESELIKRLWTDEAFRMSFEADPRTIISSLSGIAKDQLPKIVIHHEPANEWHIVVPDSYLTEDELDRVAGGQDHKKWIDV